VYALVVSVFLVYAASVSAQAQPEFLKGLLGGLQSGYFTKEDSKIFSGGCGGDPFAKLKKYGCDKGTINCSPGYNGEKGLNPNFACRLSKYFEHLETLGCKPTFSSAYRSAAHQASICGGGKDKGCAPPGRSCHGAGIAADASNISVQTGCGRALPSVAAQFGLIYGYSSDPNVIQRASGNNHIQCIEKKTTGCDASERDICGKDSSAFAFPDNGKSYQVQQNSGAQQSGAQSEVDKVNAANKQAEAQAAGMQQPQSSGGGGSGTGGPSAADGPGGAGGSGAAGQAQALQQSGASSLVLPMNEAKLSCSPEQVEPGKLVQIEWVCTQGATPRIVTQRKTRIAVPQRATGVLSVAPPSSTTYTLSCVKNTQLVAQSTCSVAVASAAKSPLLALRASAEVVSRGETVDLEWSAKHVKSGSCKVTGPDGFESSGTSGVAETEPLVAEVNTFTLTCANVRGKEYAEEVHVRTERVSGSGHRRNDDL
jgi:hypothetical protein